MSTEFLSYVPGHVVAEFVAVERQAQALANGGAVHTGHAILVNGFAEAQQRLNRHEVGGSQSVMLYGRALARYRERHPIGGSR